MREKILLVFSLAFVLSLVPLAALRTAKAGTPTLRFISEVTELGPEYAIGTEFKVALVAEDFTDLFGFDIQINWTTDYIHHLDHVKTYPAESFPPPVEPSPYGGILHNPCIPVKNVVNESKGIPGADPEAMGWFAIASMLPAAPFTGNGTVIVITFNVTDQPVFPQNATAKLHFVATTLADSSGEPIPLTTIDLEIPIYGRQPPNLKITDVHAYPKIVGYGGTLHVGVNVTNECGSPMTTNVTMYANATAVATETFTIEANNSTTVIVNASVTVAGGFDLANYSIGIYLWPVPDETNLTDNVADAGIVTVKFIGDVDGDFDVDIIDIVLITSIYGSRIGDPQFDPRSDLDGDGVITILDVVTCAANYGRKYP